MLDELLTEEGWVRATDSLLRSRPIRIREAELKGAIIEIDAARRRYARYALDKEMRQGGSRRKTVCWLKEACGEFRSALKRTDLMSYDRIAAGVGGEDRIAHLYRLLDEIEAQTDAVLEELPEGVRGKDYARWQWIESMADIFKIYSHREPAVHGPNQDPYGPFWELLQAARPEPVNGKRVDFSANHVRNVLRSRRNRST